MTLFSRFMRGRIAVRALSTALLAAMMLAPSLSPAAAAAAVTTTALAVTPGLTVTAGTVVTLTATVTSSSKPVTPGTVLFCDGVTDFKQCSGMYLVGSAQVVSASGATQGTAEIKYTPRVGTHALYAIFVGTTAYATSTSTGPQGALKVTDAPVSVTLATPSQKQAPYTLDATVYGKGSLTPPTGAVVFQDLSADGRQIATANLTPGKTTLTFPPRDLYTTTNTGTWRKTEGDFNNDGWTDIAAISNGAATLQTVDVFLNNKDGSYTHQAPSINVTIPPGQTLSDLWDIQQGDFNNDNNPDLVVAYLRSNSVEVLLGNGSGGFVAQAPVTLTDGQNTYEGLGMAVGDFNSDGQLDVAVATGVGQKFVMLTGGGDGKLTFQKTLESPVAGSTLLGFPRVGYLDADGFLDIVAGDQGTAKDVFALMGTGTGQFAKPVLIPNGSSSGNTDVQIADLTGDKINDVVFNVITPTPGIVLATGKGDGTFPTTAPLTGNAAWKLPTYMAVNDLNADSYPDLVVADRLMNAVVILAGDNKGDLKDIGTPVPLPIPTNVTAPDVSGDGIPDIVAVSPVANGIAVNFTNLSTAATAEATGVNAVGTGIHYLAASYGGDGNYLGTTSGNTTQVTATQIATKLVLGITPATSAVGGNLITMTATLTPAQYPPNIGNPPYNSDYLPVVFLDKTSNTTLGTAELQKGVATLQKVLPSAAYTIQATFAGDSNFEKTDSGTPTSYTVGPPPPQPTISLEIVPPTPVTTVVSRFTASVMVDQNTPVTAGTVTFCVAAASYCTGVNRLGSAQINAHGNASIDVYMVGRGAEDYVAVFEGIQIGTKQYAERRSPPKRAVGLIKPATTTAVLSQQGNNPDITVSATVTSVNGGNPEGLVAILNETTNTVVNNVALTPAGPPVLTLSSKTVAAGGIAASFGVADFDGDHHLDLAAANPATGVSLWKGGGNDTFAPFPTATLTATTPQDVIVADFDNDGTLDLAVAQNAATKGILPFKGAGTGAFTAQTAVGTDQPYAIAAGDFDNDGLLDLVSANAVGNSVTVWLNKGGWSFTKAPGSPVSLGAVLPQSIVVADFDNNGFLDAAVANVTGKSVTMLPGKGDGTLTANPAIPVTGPKVPQDMISGDFDNNGRWDLATANSDGSVSVMLGDGHMNFVQTAVPVTSAKDLSAIATADFNADGWQDLAVADSSAKIIGVLLNDQSGVLGTPATNQLQTTAAAAALGPITVGDFNEDGEPDALAGLTAAPGNTWLASLLLTGKSTTQPIPLGTVSPGTNNIVASYLGSANFAPTMSPKVPVIIPQIATETTLDPSGGVVSVPLTVMATVAPANPVSPGTLPTSLGTVLFTINGKPDPQGARNLTQVGTTQKSTASRTFQAADLGDSGAPTISATYTPATAEGSPYAASTSPTGTYLVGFKTEEQPSGK